MDSGLPGQHFRRGTVDVAGFSLDYADAGSPDAVTIVSFPGSAGLEMSTAKDMLTAEYRVVEINPPGWGGKNDLDRSVDMAELGGVLADAANALVDGPYYLLGTSMGGVSAIHAAVLHPDRVRGVILEAAMAPVVPEDLVNPEPPQPPTDGGGPADYPLPPPHPRKPWATEDYVRTQMQNRFKMFRWVKLDMLPEQTLAELTDRATPVLALLGDQDEILKPTQQQTFSNYLPRADFRLVPRGGHDLQNTVPEEFVARVKEFVSGPKVERGTPEPEADIGRGCTSTHLLRLAQSCTSPLVARHRDDPRA